MPRHPLVILGRLGTEEGLPRRAIGVDPASGRITAVAARLDGEKVVDHGEAVILPGAVDVHVHFRDPGHPEKEDFAAGTRAALHGGVTSVLDMPNTDPPTTSRARYEEKRAIVAPKAHCDWAIWGGATEPGAELRALAALAPAVKVYLGESTGDVTFRDSARLADLFVDLVEARFSGILAFHAEAQTDLEEAARRHAKASGLEGHAARRPAAAERAAFDAVNEAMRATAREGRALPFRVHVAHASTPALLHAARAAGVSVGVTPHHMLLHAGLPLGAFGRVNPPLRTAHDAQALWSAFVAGEVPIVESDHAPHTRTEKERDVEEAPSGVPGVETLLPLLLARAAQGEVTYARVAQATAARPAALLRVRKGRIAAGYDADLVVVGPGDVAPLRTEDLLTRCGWTPFEGSPVLFPRSVYLRGAVAVRDGDVVARAGGGRELAPGGPPEASLQE